MQQKGPITSTGTGDPSSSGNPGPQRPIVLAPHPLVTSGRWLCAPRHELASGAFTLPLPAFQQAYSLTLAINSLSERFSRGQDRRRLACRADATIAVNQGNLGILHLPLAAAAAKLPYGLYRREGTVHIGVHAG